MTTKISVYNLDNTVTSAIGSGGGGIIISSLQIATAAWVVKDDTAVDTAGGYAIITGSGFASGCNVIIGSQNASAVSFVSSTTLRVTIPAQAAGTYTVYVVNPNGAVGIIVNGLTYSGTPTWVTGSTLTSGQVDSSISIQLSATGESVTYALQAGSSLPSGLTLTSGGLLSGTVTGITVETVYNFTIEAIDAQAQESPRAFSITITANDAYFRNINLLLSADNSSNTFIKDSSNNNSNITINGDIKPSNFNPYVEGYYSNFFDGSGDWINTASSSEFNLSGSNFTVEFWVYPTSSASQQTLINFAASLSDYTGTHIWFNTSRQIVIDNGSTSQSAFTGGTLTLNSWNLVTIVRNSGTTTAYINGLSVGSNSYTPSTSAVVAVGRLVTIGYDFVGYISNLRVSKNIVRYSSNFSVPTLPFSTDANTSLLTCSSNRFIDTSNNAFAITRNGDVRVHGFDPFVPASNTATFGSGYFDGNGDYLTIASSNEFIASGNGFTIEAWVYYTSITNFSFVVASTTGANNYNPYWFIGSTSGGNWRISWGDAASVDVGVAIGLNTWNHVAMSMGSNGTGVFYVNGVSRATTTGKTLNGSATGVAIADGGGQLAGQYVVTGYISNVRYVKNSSVYTAAFTPPTEPLTAIANTSLLTLQTNQPINNHMFVDNSTVNNLITRAGNATQGSFSPYSGAWSNYFDGTGDYLTIPDNAAFDLGSGNFTFEVWVYPTSAFTTSTEQFLLDQWASSNYGYEFSLITNGTSFTGIRFAYSQTGAVGNITTRNYTQTIPLNSWSHIAIVRNSGTTTAYYNGTSIGTSSDNVTIFNSTQTVHIAASPDGGINQLFYGYLSNMRLVKGTAVYTTNFTPPTAPLTATANTSLLTCADNRFIDDSNNNFTITRNGDVSVQKFSPFSMQTQVTPRSYSVYFDGTGDFLTTTMPALGTDSFTVEFWFYPTDPTRAYLILDKGFRDGNFSLQTDYLNTGMFYLNVGGTGYNISFTPPIDNQWNHIAICRNSSSLRFFLNGVQLGTTQTNSGNVTTGTLYIGGASTTGSGYLTTQGYISNLRITTTAVYTANFTPSTTPLTSIANTSLLACQSTTLIDNSNNAFAITQNGDARPIQQNPFGYTNANTTAYTTSLLGGSMYFDGTGDSLSVATNSLSAMGSGDFTIELWHYALPKVSTYPIILSNWTATWGANLWSLHDRHADNGPTKYTFWVNNFNANSPLLTSNAIVREYQWTHIAITRSGSTWRMYINGALDVTATSSVALDAGTTYPISVGVTSGSSNLNGYISDVRFLKGQAFYRNAFVPPQAPLRAVSNTTMLLNGTSAGVFDDAMIADIETVGGAAINTSIVKFAGKSSIFFNGTNAGLFSPSSPNLSYGSGDFTIEFWYYPTSTAGTNPNIMTNWSGSGAFTSGQWSLHAPHSIHANKYSLWVASFNTGTALLVSTSNIATNTWTHIAITRTTNTWRMFINGTIEATATHSGVFDNGGSYPRYIGYQPSADSGRYITGYMSDIRLTKGVSRYTANTSAPTSPFITF